MAIETSLQPRQKWWNILYAIICGGLALWGAYDYWVTIPRREAAVAAYDQAASRAEELEAKSRAGAGASGTAPGAAVQLTEAEVAEYKAAKEVVDKGKPTAPAAYDRPVQLWLYIVGCGVMGVPFFVYSQWQLSRKRFRLGDDGSFECNEDRFTAQQITGIDMSRWMAKSIATLEVDGGRRIELDDFKYKGVEEIVAHFAARFEPEKWTSDARPHGDPKSRDTKAKREAEAAAAIAAGERPQGSDNPPNA